MAQVQTKILFQLSDQIIIRGKDLMLSRDMILRFLKKIHKTRCRISLWTLRSNG